MHETVAKIKEMNKEINNGVHYNWQDAIIGDLAERSRGVDKGVNVLVRTASHSD